jgi:hypothetical protein
MSRDEPAAAPRPSGFRRWIHRLWWLHSFGALLFGVGVMLFARQGLEYADKILIVLFVSWLLVFVAFRVIVGAQNRRPDERAVKKGLRLLTNYVIKQLYQQMYFFLVPLYASSATWALDSPNWWLAPVLLVCAVLSTMDLVFDNFIMEHRIVAASMYGLCMFAVLNLILPLVFGLEHFNALLVAAAATAPTVALLSFRLAAVFSARGAGITVLLTLGLLSGAYFGRVAVPPAPMSLQAIGVGHGSRGAYECVPGPRSRIRADRLSELRCVSRISEPGGIKSDVVHVWRHRGRVVATLDLFEPMADCEGTAMSSEVKPGQMPDDPLGPWSCTVETAKGQLIGRRPFTVVAPPPEATSPELRDAGPSDVVGGDAGAE